MNPARIPIPNHFSDIISILPFFCNFAFRHIDPTYNPS